MKKISIAEAKPGQVLAQKLQRNDGVLLAGQGSEITEGLLRMLERMNIETVTVEEEETVTPEEVEEAFQRRVDEVTARFTRVEDQPIMVALKKAILSKARQNRDESLAAIASKAPAPGDEGEGEK